MANLKINHVESSDFDCIPNEVPDVPDMDEVETASASKDGEAAPQSYVKAAPSEEGEGRKMFANKKANIAFIIIGVIVAIIIIGMFLVAKTDILNVFLK